MKKLGFIFTILFTTQLFALTPAVKYDMLSTKLIQQLKAKEYTEAVTTINEIRALGVKIPQSLDFFEGKALFESGRQGDSYQKFKSYTDAGGKDAEHYTNAIEYLIKLKDHIVKDTDTGLIWQDNRAAKIRKKDWNGAKSYCDKLTLAGYSDWRLPNYDELLSIVDHSKDKPAIKNGFYNVAFKNYWSSSVLVSDSSHAWFVSFYHGDTFFRNTDKIYNVRCVRNKSIK